MAKRKSVENQDVVKDAADKGGKEKSPFWHRLQETIALEREKRGHFPQEEFAQSIRISSQSISSMRIGTSMPTLSRMMENYPHWNFVYIITGIGKASVEPPEENEKLKDMASEIEFQRKDQRRLNVEVDNLQKERDDLKQKVEILTAENKKLEKERDVLVDKKEELLKECERLKGLLTQSERQGLEVTPGVRKGGSRTA